MTPNLCNDAAKRIAVFAGSFAPFTIGHQSILERGLQLFDRIVIVLAHNEHKSQNINEIDAHIDSIKAITAKYGEQVDVMAWNGLTTDAARSIGAKFLLRGVRTVADFEYERNLADINRAISGIDTVILFSEPQLSMVSSSMVRELNHFGHDVSEYLAK